MKQNYLLEATYADGYVYHGTDDDVSAFNDKKNCFYDVYEKLHEEKHGKLVNWAVVGELGTRYDVDVSDLPDNFRPILFKKMERDYILGLNNELLGESEPRVTSWVFGAQWNDDDGKNQKIIKELE